MRDYKDTVRMRHMLDAANEATELIEGKDRNSLDEDRVLNLALVRLLEIIGEAANQVTIEEQMEHPEIAWGQIISLRNRLIHGYDSVDFDILWQILKHDLPNLVVSLEKII